MATKKRWLMVLGMALVLFSLSNCHINDATVQFISYCTGSCPQIRLTLTSLDYPAHFYTIYVAGSSQTVVMDSGKYVWNIPTSCTSMTTGTITIYPGRSSHVITCGGGLQ